MKIPIDTKDLSGFGFTFTAAFLLLFGWNIGNLLKEMILGGFNYGLLSILVLFCVLFVFGLWVFIIMVKIKLRKEITSDKLNEEKVVSEILNQDLKLLQLKNLEIDYNLKISKWNKDNPSSLKESVDWRDMNSIAKQLTSKHLSIKNGY